MGMMMQHKYNVGDKVYYAANHYKDKTIQCPDCLGTLKWTVVFADGDAVNVDCQTCKRGYMPPSGNIVYKQWQPNVEIRTIGLVHGWNPDDGFSYMCNETGIGSGSVYKEHELFTDKEQAQIRANELHESGMKHIASNNFSKKFGGDKEIENMLSTFGFSRAQKVIKMQEFKMWAGLSGVIKK